MVVGVHHPQNAYLPEIAAVNFSALRQRGSRQKPVVHFYINRTENIDNGWNKMQKARTVYKVGLLRIVQLLTSTE